LGTPFGHGGRDRNTLNDKKSGGGRKGNQQKGALEHRHGRRGCRMTTRLNIQFFTGGASLGREKRGPGPNKKCGKGMYRRKVGGGNQHFNQMNALGGRGKSFEEGGRETQRNTSGNREGGRGGVLEAQTGGMGWWKSSARRSIKGTLYK